MDGIADLTMQTTQYALDGLAQRGDTRANNIARVHFTTPAVDRIATFAMESPHGFGKLYVCRYGDYLVGMNLTEGTTFTLSLRAASRSADSGQTSEATLKLAGTGWAGAQVQSRFRRKRTPGQHLLANQFVGLLTIHNCLTEIPAASRARFRKRGRAVILLPTRSA